MLANRGIEGKLFALLHMRLSDYAGAYPRQSPVYTVHGSLKHSA